MSTFELIERIREDSGGRLLGDVRVPDRAIQTAHAKSLVGELDSIRHVAEMIGGFFADEDDDRLRASAQLRDALTDWKERAAPLRETMTRAGLSYLTDEDVATALIGGCMLAEMILEHPASEQSLARRHIRSGSRPTVSAAFIRNDLQRRREAQDTK